MPQWKSNNSMQRTALRAAADAGRWATRRSMRDRGVAAVILESPARPLTNSLSVGSAPDSAE